MSKRKQKPKKKTKKNTPKVTLKHGLNPLNEESLRRDLSNPDRLQRMLDHLEELLKSEPRLQNLRLPPEPLLDALDDLADAAGDDLQAMDDPFQQRMTILNRILPGFLTRKFTVNMEKTLLEYLDLVKKNPPDFRACSAGLYFLEIHNQQGGEPGANPLWNTLFDVSYEEAMASAGGAVAQAGAHGDSQLRPGVETSDAAYTLPDDEELSDTNIELSRQALEYIDTGQVELGFALDTVLLGLMEITTGGQRSPEKTVDALRKTFMKEVGIHERNDLVWGLEYAVEQFKGDKKERFNTVLQAVQMLPPRENPVVFALYYKSVTEFYRYLKPGEQDFARTITESREPADPICEYARFLLESDVPNRALKAYSAAIALDPSHEIARIGAGITCWKTDSFREARLHFQRAARLWSGYLPENHPRVLMARELSELDNFDPLPENAYDLLLIETESQEEEN